MKFSLSLLKEHLKTNADLDGIVAAMLSLGLNVKSVDNPAERLKDFTIAEVLEAEKHPDADKLRVCKVATKDGQKQIVCGAPNARAGIKVAYAAVGTYVPGIDVTLSKAKIRGVESFGMMCSARELELGQDHDGIIEAPQASQIGQAVVEALNANDPIIEFEAPSNRPDTNKIEGIARELAAAGVGELLAPIDNGSSVIRELEFSASELQALTGASLEAITVKRILESLGFSIKEKTGSLLSVGIPSWRADVKESADLVEDIFRIIGYREIPAVPLPGFGHVPTISPLYMRQAGARRVLATRGMLELVGHPGASNEFASFFQSNKGEANEAQAAQSPQKSLLPQSLLRTLLTAIRENVDRAAEGLSFFEFGSIVEATGKAEHLTVVGGVRSPGRPRHWRDDLASVDVFSVKADAMAALEAAGAKVSSLQTALDAPSWFHPGRSGVLRLGPKNILAAFGEVHPKILLEMGIEDRAYAFEVNLGAIPPAKASKGTAKPVYEGKGETAIRRDFVFTIPNEVSAEAFLNAVKGTDKKHISHVKLTALNAAVEQKSLSVEVTFAPKGKTLDDEAISALSAKIAAQVDKATGGAMLS